MPKLYLIPNGLTEGEYVLSSSIMDRLNPVRLFFVEEQKSARRLLKQSNPFFPLQECRFLDLNEHSKPAQIKEYVFMAKQEDAAVISECGCPCVADPGADLVALAHQDSIEVVPLAGPSSIILALMASGLNGQNFAFNGYLPKDAAGRAAKIKALEQRAAKEKQTQIFMETPYRNAALMQDLMACLQPKTMLCVAADLTGSDQFIKTQTVGQWRKSNQSLPKRPALFIINAP